MKLTDERLKQLDNPALTPDNRALLRCRVAAELIHTGQYEAAREALSGLWQGVGVRPDVHGLSTLTTAEVLLQCGVLSGWLGSVNQVSGAQEKAKDLLFESLRMFQSQNNLSKVSEAQYELGICYRRAGAYSEARVILGEAFNNLGEGYAELKAKILIRRASVEIWTGKYHDAWNVLNEAKPFFESCNDALKGRWHGQKALVLDKLANAERDRDYLDRAIIEYTAAIFHYELSKHERYCAVNLNNLAMLLYEFNRYDEAHENLDRATLLLLRLKDDGLLAQVNETRARVLLAQHRYGEASHIIASVVGTLEKGGEQSLLADALVVQGVVLARLGDYDRSMPILRQAINLAEDSGSLNSAGLAALALIEEHGTTRLSEYEVYNVYRRADELLTDTQDFEDIRRLRMCAKVVMRRLSGARLSDKGFKFQKAVRDFEARFIDQALELEQGSVSRAARRLGLPHQSLAYLLRGRHKGLQGKRTPPQPRTKRSIIKKE